MSRKLEDGESIKITIRTDGGMTVKAVGIKGAACKEVTSPFESLGEILSDRPTAEMREEAETESVRHRAR